MKYKIIKELPFIKVGEIFGTGSWVGGGFGVDMGTTHYKHYKEGGSSHNGVRTFSEAENEILKQLIIDNADYWIEKVPGNEYEILQMFKNGEINAEECLDKLSIEPPIDKN
mgnify:CR=1 FL=1